MFQNFSLKLFINNIILYKNNIIQLYIIIIIVIFIINYILIFIRKAMPRFSCSMNSMKSLMNQNATTSGSSYPNAAGSSHLTNSRNNIANKEERVTLIVDSTRFIVDPTIFIAHSNTMLGR